MEKHIVELVKKNHCLYDRKNPNYTNNAHKKTIWDKIALELNATTAVVKNKWRSLRNAFVHTLSKNKSAIGQDDNYLYKLKYKKMEFLLPFLRNNTSKSPASAGHNPSNKTKQETNKEDDQNENLKLQTEIKNANIIHKNDVDYFFLSIAETVKALPKIQQAKLKLNIMKMVNGVEMKYLETSCAANNTLPCPVLYTTEFSTSPVPAQQPSNPELIPQKIQEPLDTMLELSDDELMDLIEPSYYKERPTQN